ncbi:HPr kinase/phosphatase C-terminal domain-containing protein [Yoonia sp.]|uniref:HPr kinase/phosphorylase n=1 Tax=Yoonia sp. TaxID=2212373 RepID=UPI0025F2E08D|nr:HPr kinase/phosphatase C-terminal domain-containing protein [Yoonia sp.]
MTDATSIHATCVAFDGRAALIKGASGSGKSATGLMLMGLGCALVADDRTVLRRRGDAVMAHCPDAIRGMIEARSVGLLNAACVDDAQVVLVVNLDETEDRRLPERRSVTLLGLDIPLIGHNSGPHFVPAILQILKAGWSNK